jgi:spermidine/putrescine transport system permease protein
MAQVVLSRPGAENHSFTLNATQLRSDMAIRRIGRVVLAVTPWIGYAFLWIPIVVLIVFSFNNSKINAVWNGFTLGWYNVLFSGGAFSDQERTLSTANLLQAVGNSLLVAATATVLSTILGTMIALGMERFAFRGRRIIDLLLYLPVVIPEVTMGLSLVIFFSTVFKAINRTFGTNLSLSLVTIIIGHIVFAMPFVTIVVRARLIGMNRSLEEAARDLGANEWQTFQRVTLPLMMPGIIAGGLLALTLSLDDFVVTFFTSGVSSTTLPIFVYSLIKFGVNPTINAISTLVVVVSMSLVLFSLALQRRRA